VRQSNSEAIARRREFKDAMRQRIRDIAASRDLSEACRAMFAGDPDVTIIEASDAEGGEAAFAAEQPDVCVLDINLPGVTGFELARRILAKSPHERIIMFSMNDDPVFVKRAIEAGAKGYVSKSGDPADLARAIREVGTGGVFLPS
jgi:two-component system, NarL family, invasion response regulator UvrY